jgi:hypothetical protein
VKGKECVQYPIMGLYTLFLVKTLEKSWEATSRQKLKMEVGAQAISVNSNYHVKMELP